MMLDKPSNFYCVHMGQNDTSVILDSLLSLLSIICLSSPVLFSLIKIIVSFLFSKLYQSPNLGFLVRAPNHHIITKCLVVWPLFMITLLIHPSWRPTLSKGVCWLLVLGSKARQALQVFDQNNDCSRRC